MALALLVPLALAGCIPAPDPVATTPAPPPPPEMTLPPAAGPQPKFENWIDAPQTPGDWSYTKERGRTLARFAPGGAAPRFAMECVPARRQVDLIRYEGTAAAPVAMTIRTETADRSVQAAPAPDGRSVAATLAASDPLLDAMAITRGRFAVETPGLPALYLPAWAEVTRVIEDCR